MSEQPPAADAFWDAMAMLISGFARWLAHNPTASAERIGSVAAEVFGLRGTIVTVAPASEAVVSPVVLLSSEEFWAPVGLVFGNGYYLRAPTMSEYLTPGSNIAQYFPGQSKADEGVDREVADPEPGS